MKMYLEKGAGTRALEDMGGSNRPARVMCRATGLGGQGPTGNCLPQAAKSSKPPRDLLLILNPACMTLVCSNAVIPKV